MSGYTGVSDYNSATRAWKDRVYLEEQAKINNINYVDGTEVLNHSIKGFEGAASKFAKDFIKDANARINYTKKIKEISNETLKAVDSGKITVVEVLEYSSKMRNVIMEETRSITSVQSQAGAIKMKKVGVSTEDLMDKYSEKLFSKKFNKLSPIEKQKVQYHIIEASGRNRKSVTIKVKRLKVLGKVLWVVTAALAIYYIATAENKVKESFVQGGTIGGGLAGGTLAGMGASIICGPGAPICFVAVILVGSVLGGLIGSEVGEALYEEAEEFTTWKVL